MKILTALGLLALHSSAERLEFEEKVTWKSHFKTHFQEDTKLWDNLGTAPLDESAVFIFGLKQKNTNILERVFWQVSDPDSPQYGKYLKNSQITKLIGRDKHFVSLFLARLSGENFLETDDNVFFSQQSASKCIVNTNIDWITCEFSIRNAMRLFNVQKFHVFRKPGSQRKYIRTTSYLKIPQSAANMIDYIGGATSKLPSVDQKLQINREDFGKTIKENFKHIGNYPTVIRERYNISSETGQHPDNSQCTPQFLEQYYHQGDLDLFWRLYGKGYDHRQEIDKVIGDVPGGLSGIEASLDTQYIMSTGNNITTWFWYTAGRHEQQEPFLQWLIDLSNEEKPPLVNSASYSDKERTVDPDYMKRINVEFMKAGARGLTLLFASGDDGAGCQENKRFEPQWPSTSPYVTTVGGTAFIHPFGIGEEEGYDISGGGFSDVFDMPDYQKDLVAGFLGTSEKLPPDDYYRPTGRGYPDIAAVSNHYWVVNNHVPVPGVLGTSASCPVVAGILAHINDYRLRSNLPPLGFVNPLLYKNPEAMTDVTQGYNSGCDLSEYYDRGFYAQKGWDPVTGLGNPNFPTMLKAAMNAALKTHAKYQVNE